MTFLDAILLGIVEGITEFLPISSTGHLILAGELLGLPASEFLKTFDIAIQLGAISAVVALYFKSFLDIEVLKRLVVAFIPTAIIGLLAYSLIKTYLIGNTLVVLYALMIGGAALILFELWHREPEDATESVDDMKYSHAFFVGLFQAIAVIPGVSRSAATILGGLVLGMRRVMIVEFSFLLAVPTIAAATGWDIVQNFGTFTAADMGLVVAGFLTSFAVALLAIRFLLRYIRTHSFIAFGIYRIIAAVLFFVVIL